MLMKGLVFASLAAKIAGEPLLKFRRVPKKKASSPLLPRSAILTKQRSSEKYVLILNATTIIVLRELQLHRAHR